MEAAVDALLARVQQLHRGGWENVLDAGTGRSSLEWLVALDCGARTAVTVDPGRHQILSRDFGPRLGPQDRLLLADWADPRVLAGETFEVVVADYLLGSLDRYHPWFHLTMLERLRTLTRGRLYLIGLEPYASQVTTREAACILALTEFRDGCHRMLGRQPHREVPLDWVEANLPRLGFRVELVERYTNHYGADFVEVECQALAELVRREAPTTLRAALLKELARLRREALACPAPLTCSFDYLVVAA